MSKPLESIPENALRLAYALYVAVDGHGNMVIVHDRPCEQGGPVRVDIGNAAIPALLDIASRIATPANPHPGFAPATVDVEQIVANALHSDDEWGGLHTAEGDIRAALRRYVGRRIVAEMPETPRGRFAPEDAR